MNNIKNKRSKVKNIKNVFVLALALILFANSTLSSIGQDQSFDISEYQGKVIYLDFWASWCGPCRLSFPFMDKLDRNYSKDDLVILTVNLDRSKAAANSFLSKVGSDLHVIYDAKGNIAKAYKVADMPTSILIDRTGKTRFVHKGFHTEKQDEYKAHINQLIQEK